MSTVMVSPHLDDAALSASTELGKGGATVVTVFTAVPPADWPTTTWDLLTGATSSRERQLERHVEDATAMKLLGARGIYLELPEQLYRPGPPDLTAATSQLAEHLSDASEVWLPSAIGGHRDHLLARDIGLAAAALADRSEIVLFADFPYVIAYGWPSAVTGRIRDPFLDTDFWLADQLANAGLDPARLQLTVTKLDPAQRERKAAVIAAYRSQASALMLDPATLAADPGKLDYELSWRMTGPVVRA